MIPNYLYEDNLQSERLITRKLTASDVTWWESFFEDPESTEFLFLYTLGLTSNLEYATHMINKQIERYRDKRFGLQVLVDKKTNVCIGLCGLLAQEVEDKREIEVGYHILKPYRKQGFATEAARLFIAYSFKNNLTDSVISVIDTENYASQKVAEKNGLTREKTIPWLDGESVFIYRIEKDNFKP